MEPIRVLISGAAGQIGYALIPLVASGQVFGSHQPVVLHLLDIEPAIGVLNGVLMEIDDGAYPLVHGVLATAKYEEAFKGINVAILVGGFPRKAGMERKELLAKNKTIFVAAGEALEKYADKNVKVLVVANPANTNCLIASTYAPSIPKENFSALTRLDMNRAQNQIAKRLGVSPGNVKNVIIWGNHSSTQVPDASFAKYDSDKAKDIPVTQDIDSAEWLQNDFVTTVQKRGAAVIAARGMSSAMSAANAAKDHMRDWFLGTEENKFVSMAVISDGSYGIEKGLVYSYPVTCKDGKYSIVQDLKVSDSVFSAMKVSEQELKEEKSEAAI